MNPYPLKALARRFAPRWLYDCLRYMRSAQCRSAARAVAAVRREFGDVVVSGPFKGLKYCRESIGSALAPKLLGTYEKELECIVSTIPKRYDLVIDIGAAEGYYAIGIARLAGAVPLIAFEADSTGRSLLKRMAEMNDLSDRIRIEGLCEVKSLNKVLSCASRPFILCDCEGGELELLNPESVPKLNIADVLVEVHGRAEVPPSDGRSFPEAMAELLHSRFEATHEVKQIPILERTLADWPSCVENVSPADRVPAMRESRWPGPGWLWMESRCHGELD
jgi:hypothetical protein